MCSRVALSPAWVSLAHTSKTCQGIRMDVAWECLAMNRTPRGTVKSFYFESPCAYRVSNEATRRRCVTRKASDVVSVFAAPSHGQGALVVYVYLIMDYWAHDLSHEHSQKAATAKKYRQKSGTQWENKARLVTRIEHATSLRRGWMMIRVGKGEDMRLILHSGSKPHTHVPGVEVLCHMVDVFLSVHRCRLFLNLRL